MTRRHDNNTRSISTPAESSSVTGTNTTNLTWIKSSFSGAGSNCVELAVTAREIFLRNSNQPDDGTVTFTRSELAAFIAGCKAGEFDDLQ